MNHPSWRQRLYYIAHFIPVRLYLLLFLAAAAIAQWWVGRQYPADPSLAGALLELLVKTAFSAATLLLLLSLASVLLPFLIFIWHVYRKKISVSIDNAEEESKKLVGRRITMEIKPLYRPFLGFLYFRFIYDEVKRSPKFSLIRRKGSLKWFSGTQSGWYHWPLPAIREYEVEQMLVYFEDIFQFFSFSWRIPVKQSFFTRPRQIAQKEAQVSPQRTEEENVRVEELKRIEGEYLNYKNFEDNDDVRRIVWKIYARNKELVVRIPEVLDPYASHIYMYASFHDSLHMPENYLVNTRGLDYFKNACWSIYSQLVKEGRMVKFFTDQPIPNRQFGNAGEQAEYSLVASNWQHDWDLLSLVPARGNAVVCISSLSDVKQLDQLLQRQQGITLVMVKLSRGLRRNMLGKWMKWVFVKPESDFEKQGFTEIRRFATLRKMKENEKQLVSTIEKFGTSVVMIAEKVK